MKAENYWDRNKLKVAVSVGVIAIGALSYWLYRKLSNHDEPNYTPKIVSSTSDSEKSKSNNSSQAS